MNDNEKFEGQEDGLQNVNNENSNMTNESNDNNLNVPKDDLLGFEFSKGSNESPIKMSNDPSYQEASNLNPKKSGMPKIIIGTAIIVVLLAGSLLAFGKNISKMISPEKYAQTAFKKTSENLEQKRRGLPDFTKFLGDATETKISLGLNYISDLAGISQMLENSSAEITFKANSEGDKALIDLSVNAGGIAINNNKLFLSKDKFALSIPMLYSDHKFVTLDTKTFIEDWNNSSYGEMGQLPTEINVEQLLESYFNTSKSLQDELIGLLENDSKKELFPEDLLNKAVFKNEGSETVLLGEKNVKLDKVSYTIASSDVKNYISNLAEIFEGYSKERLNSLVNIIGNSEYELPVDEFEEVFSQIRDAIDSIEVVNDVVIYYYINNKQLITKVESSPIVLTGADDDEDIAFSLSADMFGEEKLSDKMQIEILLMDEDDEEISIGINVDSEYKGDVINDDIEIYIVVEEELSTLDFTTFWDRKSKDFSMSIAIANNDDDYEVVFDMGGSLEESADVISLEDGFIGVTALGEEQLKLDLDFSLKNIADSEVSFDEQDSINFFDIPIADLQKAIFSLIYGF